MMWLSDGAFAGAVARAGALAFITARSFETPEVLRAEIRRARAVAAGNPVGVNLTLSRRPGRGFDAPAFLDAALAEGVRHVETAGLLPPPDLVARVRAADGLLVHKASSIRHGLAAERAGADVVALVGMEEGGHPGANELPAFVQAAYALDRITVPLAVGGGIGHGRQVAAALALGAGGVVLGSRFVVAEEIPAHRAYKERVVAADENATVALLARFGDTWRVLRNGWAEEVGAREREAGGVAELSAVLDGRIARDRCYRDGDVEQGMLSLGPACGFADRIEPAAAIVARLMDEAERRLRSPSDRRFPHPGRARGPALVQDRRA